MIRRVTVACVVSTVVLAGSGARTQIRPETVLTEYETVKLADGVYAFIAPESKTPFVSGNSLIVIGDDGVLVVDSTNVPSLAQRMIADIKQWTDKPVRFLVNTHWHPDHLMGNEVYKQVAWRPRKHSGAESNVSQHVAHRVLEWTMIVCRQFRRLVRADADRTRSTVLARSIVRHLIRLPGARCAPQCIQALWLLAVSVRDRVCAAR